MAMFGFKRENKEKNLAQAEAAKTHVKGKKQSPFGLSKGLSPTKIGEAKNKEIAVKTVSTKAIALPTGSFSTMTDVILRPRVTEKSGLLSQSGVYTFEVVTTATKASVARAIRAMYKVTPVKVAMINRGPKAVFVKGRRGSVAGFRKAMVTVKKGDKIEFV